jgi:hypothetical protein
VNTSDLEAALRRYLGVGVGTGDEELLGLDERQARVPAAIDAAARRRTEQVRRHPGAGGEDAELVIARIRLAASRLRGRRADAGPVEPRPTPAGSASPAPAPAAPPVPTSPSPPAPTPPTPPATPPSSPSPPPVSGPVRAVPPTPVRRRPTDAAGASPPSPGRLDPASLPPLTAFDRAVLGTLVGHGGWNRRSRARLVALAASHRVGPQGLLNVMRGLATYAGAGGRPAGLDEIAGDFAVIAGGRAAGVAAAGTRSTGGASAADEAAELTRRLVPELEADGVWPVLKLSALVLLAIALVSIPVVRMLSPASEPSAPTAMDPAIGTSGRGSAGSAGAGGDPGAPGGRDGAAEGADAGGGLVFARIPFLEGPPPAPGLLDAADAMAGLPGIIESEVRRRLEVAAAPGEATYRRWASVMSDAERGWARATPSDVRAVRREAAATIVAAGERPAVVERLIAVLRPPTGATVGDPTADGAPGPWAGGWRVSVLAAVAADPFAPAPAREGCRDLLAAVLAYPAAPGTDGFDPRPEAGAGEVAAAWLDLAAAELVDAFDASSESRIAEAWERWLEAADALDAGTSVASTASRLVLGALESLLRSPVVLDDGGTGSALLGRLVQSLPAPLPGPVRALVERAHRDRRFAATPDLRALGSVFALRRDLPWYRANFVVPADATDATRDRFVGRVLAVWPETTAGPESGRPLAVDAEVLLAWRETLDAVTSRPEPLGPLARLDQAARLGEVAEAAHLLAAGRLTEAASVLTALDEELVRPPDGADGLPSRPMNVPGLAAPDGAWTRSWDATRGRGDPAVARVRALRTEAGRDLGPLDARTFVDIVSRTGNQRVQEAARAILLEKFRDGPNVILELLDALPEARIERDFRQMVHRLTGITIPEDDSERWRLLARAVLLEYATSVVGREGDPAARLERRLAETFDRRAAVLERRRTMSGAVGGPAVAAHRLADAWLAATNARVAIRPVPAPASELADRSRLRRRLAADPVQSAVAGLISVGEALAFVVAAEQPSLAEACEQLLAEVRRDRDQAATASDQWLAQERAILNLWRMRLGVGPAEGDAR